jgi:hypothetical protein
MSGSVAVIDWTSDESVVRACFGDRIHVQLGGDGRYQVWVYGLGAIGQSFLPSTAWLFARQDSEVVDWEKRESVNR